MRVLSCMHLLTWNYQDVTILFSIVRTVSTGAVADRKSWRLLTDLLILPLVLVHLRYWILYTLLLQS